MDSMLVVVIGALIVVPVVAYFFLSRQHPENASGHVQPDRHGSRLMHGDVDDRPAGPGAEADGVAGRGEPAPGPSAENLPWPDDRRAGGRD